jgi:DNA-binding FadR family transcriptional regulator
LSRELLTDQAEKALTQLILDKGLNTGDLLPTESELCTELGIGRNSLREAVKALRAIGLLEVRRGAGTYVGELSLHSLADELIFHSKLNPLDSTNYLRQLSEVREALEQGLISNLISDGLLPDIDLLTTLLDQMDLQAANGHIDPTTDRKFHEALLAPLNNPVAILLLKVFWKAFDELLATQDDPVAATKSADRHHAILLAIKASDARGARVAVRTHFEGLRNRLGMETQPHD